MQDKPIAVDQGRSPAESLATVGRLYVSFWHLCLDNLPDGRFERRTIPAAAASAMIRAARAGGTLRCVSQDDLLAPYKVRERRRHEELGSVLGSSYDCPLHIEDFLCAVDDEKPGRVSIRPLQVAELEPGDRLLIVTCDYQLTGDAKEKVGIEDRFALAEDSVAFNLIEALLPPEKERSRAIAS